MSPSRALSAAPVLAACIATSCMPWLGPGAGVASATPVAVTPVGLIDVEKYQYGFNLSAPLGEDADVVSVHWDFAGVPWAAFMPGGGGEAAIPQAWLDVASGVRDAARHVWKKPVYLSLQMLSGPSRSCPADNATVGADGVLRAQPFAGCAAGCFDFSGANPQARPVVEAYVAWAAWMVAFFAPDVRDVNYGIEMNLYRGGCPAAVREERWEAVATFAQEVYNAVAPLVPHGHTSFSVQAEALLGLNGGQPCHAARNATLCAALEGAAVAKAPSDMLTFSSYPYNPLMGGADNVPWASYPGVYGASYLEVARSGFPASWQTKAVALAETGYLSSALSVNVLNNSTPLAGGGTYCYGLFDSSDADAAAWVAYLASLASGSVDRSMNVSFVAWWLDKDILPDEAWHCPCSPPDGQFCKYLSAMRTVEHAAGLPWWYGELLGKLFAHMGARDFAGGTKPETYGALEKLRRT